MVSISLHIAHLIADRSLSSDYDSLSALSHKRATDRDAYRTQLRKSHIGRSLPKFQTSLPDNEA